MDNHVMAVDQLKDFNGDKFSGGFGDTIDYLLDTDTLRRRSEQLYKENIVVNGIIDRIVDNEINTGLQLEAIPDGLTLGISDEQVEEWGERAEARFNLWAQTKEQCDYEQRATFGELQQEFNREILLNGNVLVLYYVNPVSKMPAVQLINVCHLAGSVDDKQVKGVEVINGVERDEKRRHLAYWIQQKDGKVKRIPAFGQSGRVVAKLITLYKKRKDEVLSPPLLSCVLQSLKEDDRYRDAVQRKAVINSLLAIFIKKTQPNLGTRPLGSGGARAKMQVTQSADENPRKYNITKNEPGVIIEELAHGEEPVGFDSKGIDLSYEDFHRAIVNGISWGLSIPPEILTLSFSSNYSASMAAINEYKMTLNMRRTWIGQQFCDPVYKLWFEAQLDKGNVKAVGYGQGDFEIDAAWTLTDWSGAIKPSTDILKQARGYGEMVRNGFISLPRATRELTGMKLPRVLRENKKYIAILAEVIKPLINLEKGFNREEEGTDGSD